MRALWNVALAACVLMVGAARTNAQEKGQAGITMGYPASIGVLWHVSDRVAIRPEFSFTNTDSSSASIVAADNQFWSLGTGISALFYTPVHDNLRTYVAPRFSYTRTNGDSGVTASTTTSYSIAGMFGAQYALGRRFGVFGEIGFGYARQTGSTATDVPGLGGIESQGDTIGTRSGVGVVLYF